MHKYIKFSLITWLILTSFNSYAENIDTPLSVYNRALEYDPELRAAWAGLKAEKEKGGQSTGALLPSVVLTGNVAKNREDVKITSGTGTPGETSFDSHELALTVKQPLYRKDIFTELDITSARILLAETEYKTVQQNLITRVLQRYFNVLSAHDNLEYAKSESRAIKEQLQYSKKRLDVGKSTATDFLEAKAAYDLASAEAIAAQDELDDAIDAVIEITGSVPADFAPLKKSFTPFAPEPADLDYWIDTAEKNNPSLIAARHSVDASIYEIDRFRAGHYPKLDLVARYRSEETGGRFGDSTTDDASIALQLEMPLYNGGQVSSRVRESINRAESTKESMTKTRWNIQRETRKAYRNTLTAIKRINALKLAVESSKNALASVKTGYRAGTRNNADVLNAQRELYKAQLDYSAARYMYMLNYVQLKNVTGTLSKEDVQQISSWFD